MKIMENKQKPAFVSIIMPIRNEEDFIKRSLGAVLAQDYPPDRMEVIVVDGMSTDGTRDLVRKLSNNYPDISVRLLDNRDQIVPPALNIGVRESRGDIIVRVDGHCEIARDYVRTCVEVLKEKKVECVGGKSNTMGTNYQSKGIAFVQSSSLGVGNNAFRVGKSEDSYVDTVPFGCYPRAVVNRLGDWDEELVRVQDYDFNVRLREQGGKIFYTPRIQANYFSRKNIWSLMKQYYKMGYWKARVTLKSIKTLQLRNLAPIALVIFIVLGGAISIYFNLVRDLYYLGLLVYGIFLLVSTFYISITKKAWRYIPIIYIALFVIHNSWGLGFWLGMIRWRFLDQRK